MQMQAFEMFLLGIMAALTLTFLGLSFMLWRDMNRGAEDVR